MTSAIRTLVVRRRHARVAQPWLGYELEIPDMSFPNELPGEEPLEETLGWAVPRKLFGRVEVIEPRGLVAPSAWERRYLAWLCAELEAPLADGWELVEQPAGDRPHVEDLLRRIGETAPWHPEDQLPREVIVRKADTRRLEAREAAFQIRRWVEENGGPEACRDVLVLLPRSRALLELWLEEFTEVGVPAVGVHARPVSETAIGGWVLAMAKLSGWSDESPVSRHLLREALDAPFWSQKAAGREDRSVERDLLRELIMDLRRPGITPSDWMRHLAAARGLASRDGRPARSAGIEDVEAFSRRLIERMAPGEAPIARFESLLFGSGRKDGGQAMDVRAVARASRLDGAVDVVERVHFELERLIRAERGGGAKHSSAEREPDATLAGLLADSLSKASIVERRHADPGVELLPCDLYDGRPCRHLVLAGLSESGFPGAPRILSDREERWALALGLLGDDPPRRQAERAVRWVEREISRRIDLARVALSRCEGSIAFSFATQGRRDDVEHPGGLLSLLIGGWTEKNWNAAAARQPYDGTRGPFGGVSVMRWAHEVPRFVTEARSASKALLPSTVDPEVREQLAALAGDGTCPALGGAQKRLAGPDACAAADAELESSSPHPAGPYTGRLPGRIVPPGGYSPSAIADFADCPYKYFLKRILGLEAQFESSSFPDAMEVGSILHEALAGAANEAMAAVDGGFWDLFAGGDGGNLEEIVDARMGEIEPALDRALRAFHEAAPTASRPHLEALGSRWSAAVRNWLCKHVKAGGGGAPMRVVSVERGFGMLDDPEPAVISFEGREIPLRGQIDRVDFDEASNTIVLRDYKTGQPKTKGVIHREAAAGEELQLLLYALSVEALAAAGRRGLPEGAKVAGVYYEYLRAAKDAGIDLSEGRPSGYLLADAPVTWRDIARAWAAFYTGEIENGRFDLAPRKCPSLGRYSGYCDFTEYCPVGQGETPVLETATGPDIAPEAVVEKMVQRPPVLVPSLPPERTADDETAEDLRAAHEQGQKLIADLSSEVFVAAGAGTGKTHSLVLRYLEALADEDRLPTEILCVTFSRKAAAEMRHRVRQALLRPETDEHRQLADKIRARPERFRSIILTLSGAPISTLDSLAARIVGEGDELLGKPGREVVEGVAGSRVDGVLEAFVSRRVMEGLEERDADLLALLELVTVAKATYLLTPVVASGVKPWAEAIDNGTLEEVLVERWLEPLGEIEARLLEFFATIDLEALDAGLAAANSARLKKDKPDASKRDRIGCALEALRRLRVSRTSGRAFWQEVAAIRNMPTSVAKARPKIFEEIDNAFGRKTWFEDFFVGSRGLELAKSLMKAGDPVADWSRVTSLAIRIGGAWHDAFVEESWAAGRPRYEDVTARAGEYLGSEKLREGLEARLPLGHILVDESQDTSEAQVSLITGLAGLTGATLFWVGDPKQSIYRFRGAEVDVFEGIVEKAEARQANRGTLRINYRSRRPLIEATNDLFSALLPARRADCSQDRGSEVEYHRLTWPKREDETASEPLVELIAAPAEGWLEERPSREIDDIQAAVVRRIAGLLDACGDREGSTAAVAVLVNSWDRARTYQRALTSAGIQAVVQGGGGLLSTPEVTGLMVWLGAAVERMSLAFAGMLEGPGLRMSDAGLFCLAHGFGIEGHDGRRRRLSRAALYDAFEPAAAAGAWARLDPRIDEGSLRDLLEADAAVLGRFREAWGRTFAHAGFRPAAALFRELIDALGLDVYWSRRRNGGRQAVANLQSFVDTVREMETSRGLTPRALLDELRSVDDKDQRAASGLDAGANADVIVTTYWQAKGREWPVVVLPDIERAKAGGDAPGGLAPERVLIPEDDAPFASKRVEWHIGSAVTDNSDPLDAPEVKPLDEVRRSWRGPAERAESRRLLYVAMTRAKERLVLAGTFPPPTEDEATCELPNGSSARGIADAKTWAEILGVCFDLRFDDAGTPGMGERSLCTARQVRLLRPADVEPSAESEPRMETRVDGLDPALVRLWNPLPFDVRERLSPSRAEPADLVPPPLGPISWPEGESGHRSVFGTMDREGSAFHEAMEAWGFGGPRGIEFTRELVVEVLERLEMHGGSGEAARVDCLMELYAKSRRMNPELFELLERASRAGNLYPEISVRYTDEENRLVEGYIDLAWRDEAGWHVLDYKAGWRHPHAGDSLTHAKLRQHYAQTALYAEGLRTLLPGEPVADFGVWYVACGLVVRWGA